METMPPLNVGRPSAISRIKLAYLARSLSRKFSIVLYRRLSVLATETKSHYLRDCGRVAHSSPRRALWLCGPTPYAVTGNVVGLPAVRCKPHTSETRNRSAVKRSQVSPQFRQAYAHQ